MVNEFNLEKIMTFFNYIFWFFMGNVLFWFCNLPMVLFFLFIGFQNVLIYLPLFLASCILFAPAFTALLYTMGKLLRNKDINIFSDYFKSYKDNFIQSFFLGIVLLLFILILYFNISFFKTLDIGIYLTPFFVVILSLLLLSIPYIFILLSRYKMKSINLLKTSIILIISKPLVTISNIIVFLFCLMLFEIKPSYAALFIATIFSFLLMFVNKHLLNSLENKK